MAKNPFSKLKPGYDRLISGFQGKSDRFISGFLGIIETGGNALPHPATLFAIMALLAIIVSGITSLFNLSVNAPDSGAAEEELAVAYGDEQLEIGFNAKYLLEIASQIDRENAILMFNGPGDPTLVHEGDDTSAIYVVMPMRV